MEEEEARELLQKALERPGQPKSKLRIVHKLIVIIRDVALAGGVPVMIGCYLQLHKVQTEAEQAKYDASQEQVKIGHEQIEVLKATNVGLTQEVERWKSLTPDNVAKLIEGTKKVAEEQIAQLQKQVGEAQRKQQDLAKERDALRDTAANNPLERTELYKKQMVALEAEIEDLEAQLGQKSVDLVKSRKEIEQLNRSLNSLNSLKTRPAPGTTQEKSSSEGH